MNSENNILKVGIIGTGNIGCDLLVKVQNNPFLKCALFMGRNLDSKGMRFANSLGVRVSDRSINALIENPSLCDIVFDATTASSHLIHAPILKKLGKFAIDLTPSLIGKMCSPVVNGIECLREVNVNMITCGGQATVPIVSAINNVLEKIDYVEIVSSISSSSAGAGTRANIDEFTQTTKTALETFSKTKSAKAIIVLNPAEPPIVMHNTIYVKGRNFNLDEIKRAIQEVVLKMQSYVSGYKIINEPVIQNDTLVVMVQVEGRGDYLPKYSGNLDIITSSAVQLAQMYAQNKIEGF